MPNTEPYQPVVPPTQVDGYESADAPVLENYVQGEAFPRSVMLASGAILLGDGSSAPTAAAEGVAPPRVSWVDAGGSLPVPYGLDSGDLPDETGTVFDLGTGAVQDSSWNTIGKEAFWSCRIVAGTGAVPTTEDQWALGGFPVAPNFNTGHGRVIGQGFALDAEDSYRPYIVLVVIDPFYSTTRPVLFYFEESVATTDPAGLNSAAGTGAVTTDTPEVVATHTVLGPTYIGAGGGIFLSTTPFDFDDGCILNLSGQFETV